MATSWDGFLHLHGGHALAYADIAALYRALPSPRTAGARAVTVNDCDVSETELLAMYGETPSAPQCVAPMPLAWSEFLRVYGEGHGQLSQHELLLLFQQHRRAWTPIAPYPPPAPAPAPPSAAPAEASSQSEPPPRLPIMDEKPRVSTAGAIIRGTRASRGRGGRAFSGERTPQHSTIPGNEPVAVSAVTTTPSTDPSRQLRIPAGDSEREMIVARTFQEITQGSDTLPDTSRVTDLNGKDVSVEEVAVQFKSLLAIVTNATPPNGPNAATQATLSASPSADKITDNATPVVSFRDTSEASRQFFNACGHVLSLEEVRVAQYAFKRVKTVMTPFAPAKRPPTRRFVKATSRTPTTTPPSTLQEHAAPNELLRDEWFAVYPPSTEQLPRISVLSRSSSLHSTASMRQVTIKGPTSTSHLFAPLPVHREPSKARGERYSAYSRPTGRRFSSRSTPSMPSHSTLQTNPTNCSARHTSVPAKSTIQPERAVYPPSARSLPWDALRTAVQNGSNQVLVDFESLSLKTRSLEMESPMPQSDLMDPELMLFPLPLFASHDAHTSGDRFHADNQDQADPSLDALIKSGCKLSVALSQVYRIPQRKDTTTAPEEPPELEGALSGSESATTTTNEDETERMDDGGPVASPDPRPCAQSPRVLELLPNRQLWTLSRPLADGSSTGVPKTVADGALDTGERVTATWLDAPSKNMEAEFFSLVTVLTRATAHESIARVFGAVDLKETSQVAVVTERIDGWTPLTNVNVDVSHFAETQKLQLLVHIAEAMERLHCEGVAHGDLNPEHVMVSQDSTNVKLVHAGHSRLVTLVASTNQTRLRGAFPDVFFVNCSPAYAAPEVLRGDLSKSDTREWMQSDIFALTVIVTEVLRGWRSWEGETPMYVWSAVTKRMARPFDVHDIHIQGGACRVLETLIRRGWHEDPALRPSAAEMAQGLRVVRDSLLIHSEASVPSRA